MVLFEKSGDNLLNMPVATTLVATCVPPMPFTVSTHVVHVTGNWHLLQLSHACLQF